MDKRQIFGILTKEIPEQQISIDEPMTKHTSFKIGGNADIFVKVQNEEELKYVVNFAKENDINLTVIGNGSNILVKDNGIRGIVLKLQFNSINIENDIVTVGAGVKLGELAQVLLKNELTGFEFASGIPATIGGAIKMNAGAYGGEMKDIVLETKCLVNGEVVVLNNEEQKFTYRHSIFSENDYIIIETKLKLKKGNYEEIKNTMKEYLENRKVKQPIHLPSAGSTFKRGVDYITAKIIDECDLKGYSIGDAQVSTLHAGFVVNKGNAKAKDVLDLIKHIQDTVYQKTGKKIELEIEIVGE